MTVSLEEISFLQEVFHGFWNARQGEFSFLIIALLEHCTHWKKIYIFRSKSTKLVSDRSKLASTHDFEPLFLHRENCGSEVYEE